MLATQPPRNVRKAALSNTVHATDRPRFGSTQEPHSDGVLNGLTDPLYPAGLVPKDCGSGGGMGQ
eukprot:4197875-Heterocapsa_arctica.AAC.1